MVRDAQIIGSNMHVTQCKGEHLCHYDSTHTNIAVRNYKNLIFMIKKLGLGISPFSENAAKVNPLNNNNDAPDAE